MYMAYLFVIVLLATLAPLAAAADDWNTLLEQHVDSSNQRLRVDAEELGEEGYREFLIQHRQQDEKRAAKFVALAEKPGGHPLTSYMALEVVLTNEYAGPAAERAAEILIANHLDNRLIHELTWQLAFSQPASLVGEQVLRSIIDKSPDREVVAMALVSLGRFLRERADAAQMIALLPSRRDSVEVEFGKYYIDKLEAMDTSSMKQEAEKLLFTAKKDYTDVARGIGSRNLQELADDELFHLRHLSIGRKAQEIVGVDVHGERFSLSDYDGSVRVLLFWGHWCGPCRKGYPTYRGLVDRYANRPFAFLGIDSDKEKSTLETVIESGEVTWRCWWDGGEDPMPIHEQWSLRGAPHLFVLDSKGRIRFTDVRGKQLEEAVELLMLEHRTDQGAE